MDWIAWAAAALHHRLRSSQSHRLGVWSGGYPFCIGLKHRPMVTWDDLGNPPVWGTHGKPQEWRCSVSREFWLASLGRIPDFRNGIVTRMEDLLSGVRPYSFHWPFPRPRKGEMKLTPQTCSWSSSNHPAHLGFHTSANQCTSGTRPVVIWLTLCWCRWGRPAITVTCKAGWIIRVKWFDVYETFQTLAIQNNIVKFEKSCALAASLKVGINSFPFLHQSNMGFPNQLNSVHSFASQPFITFPTLQYNISNTSKKSNWHFPLKCSTSA